MEKRGRIREEKRGEEWENRRDLMGQEITIGVIRERRN